MEQVATMKNACLLWSYAVWFGRQFPVSYKPADSFFRSPAVVICSLKIHGFTSQKTVIWWY